MSVPSSLRPLAFLPFQHPTLTDAPPSGAGWIHEIKQDGYRTQIIVDRGAARAFSRSGYDWTKRYPGLVKAAARLAAKSAVIDGEAIIQDDRGVSDFHAFRAAIGAEPHRVVFFAFDLLHLDGRDLRKLPLLERREHLERLLAGADQALQFSEAIAGDGRKVFAAAEQLGVEGIVSKRANGCYESGRSREWFKAKCMVEGEFVVVGVEPNLGGPPFALLARESDQGLAYAGSAFVTLRGEERETFWEATELLKVKAPAVTEIRRSKVSFLKPQLRVRAKYLRGERQLRHASLVELIG
jgi:bifunctional non-homologous end joining protein LigD